MQGSIADSNVCYKLLSVNLSVFAGLRKLQSNVAIRGIIYQQE